jgi:type II secretory pathway pseudopilin PulG
MGKVSFGNGAPILQKEYSIPPHMYDSAFKDYQKKFVYPTNYIITAVCAVLALLGIILVATGKSAVLILISVLCVAVIIGLWMYTGNVRKKFVQSVAQVRDERQTAQFFDEGIIITSIPKGSTSAEGVQTVVDFTKDEVKILDRRYYFIAYVVKSTFCIIPKKVFDASEETTLVKGFQKKLGKNYIK